MSSSEHDFSDGSGSSWSGSPYSSPSQHVPQLASALSGITCEDVSMHVDVKSLPFLRITEQPQDYFRFRYKSEMVGTHGCLLGKSTTAKNKSHPTVELVNYTGKAIIRCRLSQADKDEDHPHKLFEDEQEDRDVSTAVPEHGSYKVSYAGMGIIHTAKKDVPGLLFNKYMEKMKSKKFNVKELREHCESMAKSINLNIVRLRFSAHDVATDQEVCPPVFSEPIHNMKSAAVNDLKICRMDRHYGRAQGSEDVFLLVEKVNKKNIKVRLFEMNDVGEEVWSANGKFLLNDVHHQYAIVFRTPPYKDPHPPRDVKVFIELVRPSDGRTSEPKEFVYKADPMLRHNKRRRLNSPYSSLESSRSGSLRSWDELPVTVEMINERKEVVEDNSNVPVFHIEIPAMPIAPITPNADLAEALYAFTAPETVTVTVPSAAQVAPVLSQPNVPEPPVIQLSSSELERLIDPHLPSEERKKFCETDWTDYIKYIGESLSDKNDGGMDFIRESMQLVADGGGIQSQIKKEPLSSSSSDQCASIQEQKRDKIAERLKGHNEYSAFYSAEDGNEVKKLVKEICELIKNKRGYNKQIVRTKLQRLFELKLSNGDTFLHMTLCSNQSSFDFIVRLIHSLKMPHLLNKTNDLHQTILHLAVINDMPAAITKLLVEKGCDPMLADNEGNNAIHYAVICQSCLEPLLRAIKLNDVACDLNAYNQDKQTALHLAAIYDSEQSAKLLLQYGASYSVADSAGRTALHLAAYDGHLAAMRALVAVIAPGDIDAVDGCGNTALQIVCGGGEQANTVEMIELLLENKADPTKHEENNRPAWRMCFNKPALWDVMRPYVPENYCDVIDDDIKSEPEDDFESADEGLVIAENLVELPLYIEEVSRILDAGGGWRALAERTRAGALLSWFQSTHSPARTLLAYLKETGENLTSKSLAMLLQDMGQFEAAGVIRRYVSD